MMDHEPTHDIIIIIYHTLFYGQMFPDHAFRFDIVLTVFIALLIVVYVVFPLLVLKQ